MTGAATTVAKAAAAARHRRADGGRPAAGHRRSDLRRRAILAAAAALVAEAGYAAVTIDAIAARAGAGKQTIYRWWPSKPALYVEVYDGLVPRAVLAADLGAAEADLVAVLDALFAGYRSGPAAAILAGLIGAAASDAAAAEAVRAGLVVGRGDLLTGPVRRAVARGELPAGTDADLVARTIVALVWHDVLMGRAAGLGRADAETIVAVALRGACGAGPARPPAAGSAGASRPAAGEGGR